MCLHRTKPLNIDPFSDKYSVANVGCFSIASKAWISGPLQRSLSFLPIFLQNSFQTPSSPHRMSFFQTLCKLHHHSTACPWHLPLFFPLPKSRCPHIVEYIIRITPSTYLKLDPVYSWSSCGVHKGLANI